jgi:hypothetical protein
LTSGQIIHDVLIAIGYDLPAIFNFAAGTGMTLGFIQLSLRDRERSDRVDPTRRPPLSEDGYFAAGFHLAARPGGLLTGM